MMRELTFPAGFYGLSFQAMAKLPETLHLDVPVRFQPRTFTPQLTLHPV
jgi:hypothetical protein